MNKIMGIMVPPPKSTTTLKRTADEAKATDAKVEGGAQPEEPAPSAPTPAASSAPFKSPTSEVKRKSAAQSLANLFSSGSDEFDGGENVNNDLVTDLMGAATDNSKQVDIAASVQVKSAENPQGTALASIAEGGTATTATNDQEPNMGFASPRKKSRTGKSPVNAPEEELALPSPAPVSAPAAPAPTATAAPVMTPQKPGTIVTRRAAAAAAAAHAAATEAAAAAATEVADALINQEEGNEEQQGKNILDPTTVYVPKPLLPETTPQRVAGASVLASLGGSGNNNSGGVVKQEISAPPGLAPVVEIATSEGAVKHDYLLQNLVHATQVTSPLPVPPGKGKKFTHPPVPQPLRAVGPPLPPNANPFAPSGVAPHHPPPPAVPSLPPQQPAKSRKEKSLGVLCQNFMELFKNAPPNRDNNGTVIEICQVADHLQVKRRRIYDVINILESIDIVCRVKKNTYRWHGLDGLPRFFADLQKEGLQERAARAAATAAAVAAGGDPNLILMPPGTVAKTKGMAQTCQKLIQIFLTTGRIEIGLTDAAEEVLGPLSPAEEANSQRAMKTKVRRMYDIANVLQSIGILQKENVGSTSLQNKPSFRWVYHILPSDMGQYLHASAPPAPLVAAPPPRPIPTMAQVAGVVPLVPPAPASVVPTVPPPVVPASIVPLVPPAPESVIPTVPPPIPAPAAAPEAVTQPAAVPTPVIEPAPVIPPVALDATAAPVAETAPVEPQVASEATAAPVAPAPAAPDNGGTAPVTPEDAAASGPVQALAVPVLPKTDSSDVYHV